MDEITNGATTIAPTVLSTIARLTTLATPGVSRMAPIFRVAGKANNDGIKVVIKDSLLFIDVYVIINSEENVRVVSESIQQRVSRSISEMVGMEIAGIDVHVTDIDIDA